MITSFINRKSCMIAVGLLLTLLCNSCQDDLLGSGTTNIREGMPATVTLRVQLNNMSEQSRSIANEDAAHNVDNLWIGIYKKSTGDRLDYTYLTSLPKDPDDGTTHPETYYDVKFGTTSAKEVYIVGVANVDVNLGLDKIGDYENNSKGSTLLNMLNNAKKFDDFKAITVLRPDPTDVNVYANTLTMSGWYAEKTATDDEKSDVAKMPTVDIGEGENAFTGAIYLKRLIAYNKFIISAGPNITMSLNSWKVCNVPAGSYLFEQTDNVGDLYEPVNKSTAPSFYNSSLESHLFELETVTNDDGTTSEGRSFEFYQMENKHDAVKYAPDGNDHVGIDTSLTDDDYYNLYNEREREYKDSYEVTNSDGTTTQKATNTRIYRSLVKADKSNLHNNEATYVVFNAALDYYVAYPESGELKDFDADSALPVGDDYTGQKIHRVANVTYTVHLGFCDGAGDFNCARDTKYTYNVKINGVKNVVVEARNDDEEPQPGTEGWVSDDVGEFVRLDSHYCEFNIALTDAERETLTYRVTAPYDGKYYYYSRDENKVITKTEGMNQRQYDWIKFYPTEDGTTLAKYHGGLGENKAGVGTGLWTLDDMCKPTVKENTYAGDAQGRKWYTVFVDEYVYHFDDNGYQVDSEGKDVYTKETSWGKYTNQDDRMVELIINMHVSKDNQSSYSYCKYAFSQKSIQTFYRELSESETALGIEHIEETYCLNMNWYHFFVSNWGGGFNYEKEREAGHSDDEQLYDYNNGRWNQWKHMQKRNITEWSSVIEETTPATVQEGHNEKDLYSSHKPASYNVYMPKAGGVGAPANKPSNNDPNNYVTQLICMNRNRDLNGDGHIDEKEVKWYLPTSNQYIQIAIAQEEMPDPIIRFYDYSPDLFIEGWKANSEGRTGTYNFHYATSDVQYFWAEQGSNVGDAINAGWGSEVSVANTVRCVRNLGSDPTVEPKWNTNEISPAFTYDSDARTFTQDKFTLNSLRGYSPSALAPHDIASPNARPYKKFEVAKKLCRNVKDQYISIDGNASINYINCGNDEWKRNQAWLLSAEQNGLCGKYTEAADGSDLGTWRLPSIYELGLMWTQNLLQTLGATESNVGSNNCYLLSASYDYFVTHTLFNKPEPNHEFMGYNDYWNRHVPALDVLPNYAGQVRVLCVRDVQM